MQIRTTRVFTDPGRAPTNSERHHRSSRTEVAAMTQVASSRTLDQSKLVISPTKNSMKNNTRYQFRLCEAETFLSVKSDRFAS
jgi:hypothetical protein